MRGFGVKLYGSGRRVFALRYRTHAGRQRMLTLGALGELTVEQARNRARSEKVGVLNGTDPQRERQLARQRSGIETVEQLMRRWLDEHAKPHLKSWKESKWRIEARIVPALGKLRLVDVTPAACRVGIVSPDPYIRYLLSVCLLVEGGPTDICAAAARI